MIRLIVIRQGESVVVASALYFRITGGAVWIGPGQPGETPLVRIVGGQWQYSSSLWAGLRFEGKCRLVFGLAREPLAISEVLQGLSMCKGTLTANGIPFAQYNEEYEMWKGATANSWWHAFRVESAGLREPSATSNEESTQLPEASSELGAGETRPSLNDLASTSGLAPRVAARRYEWSSAACRGERVSAFKRAE